MILNAIDEKTRGNSIQTAAAALARGEIVAIPTETVYGLAADACNEDAVKKVYAAKARPQAHPLIVHIASHQDISHFADENKIPAYAQNLIQAFWPGSLTIILPRKNGVAKAAAGGHDTIALRCPAHTVAKELLAECRKKGIYGLAAPSANPFGQISPTLAAHVADKMEKNLLILDGGKCEAGIESTIIDATGDAPILLRPGPLNRNQIEKAAKTALQDKNKTKNQTPASGTLASHYAPKAKVRLMSASEIKTGVGVLGELAKNIAIWTMQPIKSESKNIIIKQMPDDANKCAAQLFETLQEFDKAKVKLIWIQSPPETTEWEAVKDRLTRAAA